MDPISPAHRVLLLLREMELTDGNSGWLGCHSTMPEKGDQVVVVVNTTPVVQGRFTRTLGVMERSGIMIQVRSATSDVGWTKIREIADALAAVNKWEEFGIGPNGTKFLPFIRSSGPVPMGREQTNVRHLFSVNFTVILEDLL